MEMTEFEKPTRERMEMLLDVAAEAGVPVRINGMRAEIFAKGRDV